MDSRLGPQLVDTAKLTTYLVVLFNNLLDVQRCPWIRFAFKLTLIQKALTLEGRQPMLSKLWLFAAQVVGLIGLLSSPQVQASHSCQQALQEIHVDVQLAIGQVYVEGEAHSGQLLFLSSAEYQHAVKIDSIPIDSIIVLDELPLIADLPLVAGIIISKEMEIEATHVQVLAEKMEIPLVYVSGAFQSSELRALSKENQTFLLKCDSEFCKVAASQVPFSSKARFSSILPRNADRSPRTLFTHHDLLENSPREQSGDKYYSLMEFKKVFPNWVPDISSISSGYYEFFMDNYESRGSLLRSHQFQLVQKLKEASKTNDEETIKFALAEFRENILTAKPYRTQRNIFRDIINQATQHYWKTKIPYSLRSNNDVEDLLATGLYKSAVAKELSLEEVEHGLRKIWASMYEYRAYAIRRFWGQNEDNLSMPIMLHPFIGEVMSHSVGLFKYNSESGLRLEINMVMGENEKATNPSANAEVVKLTVQRNNRGQGEIIQEGTDVSAKLPAGMENAILTFFNSVQRYVSKEFVYRNFTPTSINIEFVVQNPRFFWNSPKVRVLQYKPSLNREIVFSVLSGMLTREETDRRNSQLAKLQDSNSVIKRSTAKKLDEVVPEQLWAYFNKTKPRHKRNLRYVLLMDDGNPYFIVWDSGVLHAGMKIKLSRSKLQWFKSGYITLKTSGTVPTLVFTETTVNDETDRALLLPVSKKLFDLAFASAVNKNAELRKILETVKPNIVFRTFEGSGNIEWPPNIELQTTITEKSN